MGTTNSILGGSGLFFLLCLLVVVLFGLPHLVWRVSRSRLAVGFTMALLVIGLAAAVHHVGVVSRRARLKASGYPEEILTGRTYDPRPLQFDGNSAQLQRTIIVPTLDAPVEPGKNVIWCASFQAGWKKLQSDLAKEPVVLPGAEAACAALNGSPMPDVPDGELYTAAGWEDKGILDEIRREKERLFPGSAVPEFPDIMPGSFIVYAYLQSKCKFDIPYFDSSVPTEFKDSTGKTSQIRTFGIRVEDDYAYEDLRQQVGVLYRKPAIHVEGIEEFALDLCKTSTTTQVVFAKVPIENSLLETVTRLEERITGPTGGIGPNDILLVPEIGYKVVHHFSEFEQKAFENAALAGQRVDVAQQDIEFRLDRSGAELTSEVKSYMSPIPSLYIADGPFLLYLKKRGAPMPYFAMWVDNDELLTKWAEQEAR